MIRSIFMAPAGSDLGQGMWADNPPAAAPVSVAAYINEETGIVSVYWVNGDLTAWTQVGRTDTPAETPTVSLNQLPPRTTGWSTGTSDLGYWWVRHTKGGTPSAWTGPAVV